MSITRRALLGGGTGAAAVVLLPEAEGATGERSAQPIAKLSDLVVGGAVAFSYPDPLSPAWLLKVGRAVPGGVGPEEDVVAYSALCTHLGCPVTHKDGRFVCPCHWSQFDPAARGRCYQGPAPASLPQIRLALDGDGTIHATGIDGIVWGRISSAPMGAP